MSVQAISWALSLRVGSAQKKVLLLALANYADADGACWPSYRLLADQTEISRRTITRLLPELVAGGWLKIEARTSEDNSRTSNLYRLQIDTNPGVTVTPSPMPRLDTTPVSLVAPHRTVIEPSVDKPPIPPEGEDTEFKTFCSVYPKRLGGDPRKPAAQKFAAAKRRGVAGALMIAAAQAYASEVRNMGKEGTEFVALKMTWLNQERWNEYAPKTNVLSDERRAELIRSLTA